MRIGPPIPLFTESELASAFSYLLAAPVARRVAREWFEMNASEHSDDSHFMYEPFQLGDASASKPAALASGPSHDESVESIARSEAAFWNGLSEAERIDMICPRFTGIHFDLVAQLSEEHAERMRLALRDSPEDAALRRQIVRRVLELVQVP